MVMRIEVRPELLRWARERAGKSAESLSARFPKLGEWESGALWPTMRQLEEYARATYAPFGCLLLPEPPVEQIPIPDLRTMAGPKPGRLSPNLLDMIGICQQRQDWYREHARTSGLEPPGFVSSASLSSPIEGVAGRMREALGLDIEARRSCRTWTEALRQMITRADALGVLVMCSGVVLNNTRRKLDPEEFRGFALVDQLAPLVFVNGSDTKAAQMFTLAHELAHIWLGQTALSDAWAASVPDHSAESWCNRVAAELLVPLKAFQEALRDDMEMQEEAQRLARRFKVSTLVILRRMHDAGALTHDQLWQAYRNELARLEAIKRASGGSFYPTQLGRTSRRFSRALIVSALEGQTLLRDAMQMLGIRKIESFHRLRRKLGIEDALLMLGSSAPVGQAH